MLLDAVIKIIHEAANFATPNFQGLTALLATGSHHAVFKLTGRLQLFHIPEIGVLDRALKQFDIYVLIAQERQQLAQFLDGTCVQVFVGNG